MKIIIFEGIASSGKTTIERLLAEALPNSRIITEGETLMSLIDNRDPNLALKHLTGLLTQWRKETVGYLIVDRFHFTHAFRTRATLKDFSSIESLLQKLGQTLLVLLTIDDNNIKERIEATSKYRKGGWKKGAPGTTEEKAAYYTEQQERLKRFQQETTLSSLLLDTTDKNWPGCLTQIMNALQI